MRDGRALLLSIRPQHATGILRGTKTVELRRVRPQVQAGDVALVYATYPVCAVIAVFTIDRVLVQSPGELWAAVAGRVGIDRREFDDYLYGASTAVAIFLTDLRRLSEPVPLSDLQAQMAGFRPPQSFRYVRIPDCDKRILAALMA